MSLPRAYLALASSLGCHAWVARSAWTPTQFLEVAGCTAGFLVPFQHRRLATQWTLTGRSRGFGELCAALHWDLRNLSLGPSSSSHAFGLEAFLLGLEMREKRFTQRVHKSLHLVSVVHLSGPLFTTRRSFVICILSRLTCSFADSSFTLRGVESLSDFLDILLKEF